MPDITLEMVANQVIETLDAQQKYYKAAKALQKGIGTYEEKMDLFKKSVALEKKLRDMASEILTGPKPTQQNLFK